MDIDNLSQFNSKEFFRLFGFYVQQSRLKLKLSLEQLSLTTRLTPATLEQVELGRHHLTNADLKFLVESLLLDKTEILNLAKITQVQNIIDVSRELNANFPQ